MSQKVLSFICFKVLEKSKKRESSRNWFWSLFQYLFSVFSSIFLCYSLFQTLCFLTLELSSLILSIGYCFVRKIICGLLWSPGVVCDHWIIKIVIFSLLWLYAYPFCVEVIVFERGVVYSKCRVVIPRWISLGGRSCVDIVKILLCEGENLEQWFEPRTYLIVCIWSTISKLYLSYILHCFILHIFIC